MVASPVPFSNSQTPMRSLNKSHYFPPNYSNPSTASPEKEKDNTLAMSNNSNLDVYIDSVYNKTKFVNLKYEILQSLQGDIKISFDNEFNNFKLRQKDLLAKSRNTSFHGYIKHLQEKLKSKDKIMKQTLT